MSTDRPRSTPTKVCPSCGTRVSETASRCLVCGHQFEGGGGRKASTGSSGNSPAAPARIGRSGMAAIRLSLPVAIGLLALFLIVGGGLTYFGLNLGGQISAPTSAPSVTPSPSTTPTPTPETPTATSTPQPTFTPLTYNVQSGDTCGSIAFAFSVSSQSIILANSLDANCNLFQGQVLSIPHPTFTPTPIATSTLSNAEATIQACETVEYVVQEGDSLSLIAATYGVPLENLLRWNGLTSDTAFLGQRLFIPLCERSFNPVTGATSTPTPAPPYPAPELLLPSDGQPFAGSADTVTLQWSSVGTLRDNELYQVTIVDITGGQNESIVTQVRDTKFIVPASFRPTDGQTHIYRWFVVPVAQIGVDSQGRPVYAEGGPVSISRVFSWGSGSGAPAATPTPTP